MKPFVSLVGSGAVLRIDNVDTDQIIAAEDCKRLTKTGFADVLFARWRAKPDFFLNRPEYAKASILIAGENFGTGSSREHAVWALRDWGFRAVFASSFGDIFRRNALKNGLLAIQLEGALLERLRRLVEVSPELKISILLTEQTITVADQSISFIVDDRARWLLVNGYDEIAVTLNKVAQIERYERAREEWLPTHLPSPPEPSNVVRVRP
jgi:3-isopropylmalate/(R)-2-methylmalate dehydratase small subunit